MPWRIINSELAIFKPFFAFFWLAQGLNDSLPDDAGKCFRRHALPSCQGRPYTLELDDVLFQILKFREDSWLRAKFSVVMEELFKCSAKAWGVRPSIADRSFNGKGATAKSSHFRKKILSGLIFCSFSTPQSSLITPGVFKISTKFIS